jgi:hypothetical protein
MKDLYNDAQINENKVGGEIYNGGLEFEEEDAFGGGD